MHYRYSYCMVRILFNYNVSNTLMFNYLLLVRRGRGILTYIDDLPPVSSALEDRRGGK